MHYSVPEIVLIALIDVILFIYIETWTQERLFSLLAINVMLVVCVVFGIAAPSGKNNDVFIASSWAIGSFFLIVELVVGIVLMFIEMGWTTTAVSQSVIIVVAIVVLSTNLSVNKRAVSRDTIRAEGMNFFRMIESNLDDAMGSCDDIATKRAIEVAYDAVAASTARGDKNVEHLDQDLFNLSARILDSVTNNDYSSAVVLSTELTSVVSKRERLVRNR